MSVYILDAHSFMWFLEGNSKLTAAARKCIEESSAQLILPVIALAEICSIIEKGKSSLTVPELFAAIDADKRLIVEPLDRETVIAALKYPSLEIHDRLIVATFDRCKIKNPSARIVTADRVIQTSVTEFIW